MTPLRILVRLSTDLLARLHRYRAHKCRSRSELERLIVDAYTQRPQDDVWGDEAGRRMIAAEPW